MPDFLRQAGNRLYQSAFPLYRPLYSAFKAYADRAERRILANVLAPGSVVVDGGANIGVYSQFLSRCVGASGMVHSFEPSPHNFARLRTATADLSNVRANQLAVSDISGEQLLYLSSALNVDHRTYPVDGESRNTVCIRATRLDDYFKPNDRVDLIKLDVQGYELHALRGAKRVLVDNSDIKILLEFWPAGLRTAGSSPEALLALLTDYGFTTFALDEDRLKEYGTPAACDYGNKSFFNLFAHR